MRWLFVALLSTAVCALSPALAQFRGSPYAAVRVDPRRFALDLVTAGRTSSGWTDNYCGMPPGEAVLNGTFFSLRFHEPAGVLVYANGSQEWTPRFARDGVSVVSLHRRYLAVYRNGQVRMGNSLGRGARALRQALEPPALRSLLGGGGQLTRAGQAGLDLAAEGFDQRSGLRPQEPLPRSGVGLDSEGQVWLVSAERLGLRDFADLVTSLGAREAMFLDCGSSTSMRVGDWSRDSRRPLPTWLVVSAPH